MAVLSTGIHNGLLQQSASMASSSSTNNVSSHNNNNQSRHLHHPHSGQLPNVTLSNGGQSGVEYHKNSMSSLPPFHTSRQGNSNNNGGSQIRNSNSSSTTTSKKQASSSPLTAFETGKGLPNSNSNRFTKETTTMTSSTKTAPERRVRKKKVTKKCVVQDCKSNAKSRGLCKKHGGGARCQIEGCKTSARPGGLCIFHGGGLCKVRHCNTGARTAGLCLMHTRMWNLRKKRAEENGEVPLPQLLKESVEEWAMTADNLLPEPRGGLTKRQGGSKSPAPTTSKSSTSGDGMFNVPVPPSLTAAAGTAAFMRQIQGQDSTFSNNTNNGGSGNNYSNLHDTNAAVDALRRIGKSVLPPPLPPTGPPPSSSSSSGAALSAYLTGEHHHQHYQLDDSKAPSPPVSSILPPSLPARTAWNKDYDLNSIEPVPFRVPTTTSNATTTTNNASSMASRAIGKKPLYPKSDGLEEFDMTFFGQDLGWNMPINSNPQNKGDDAIRSLSSSCPSKKRQYASIGPYSNGTAAAAGNDSLVALDLSHLGPAPSMEETSMNRKERSHTVGEVGLLEDPFFSDKHAFPDQNLGKVQQPRMVVPGLYENQPKRRSASVPETTSYFSFGFDNENSNGSASADVVDHSAPPALC